MQRKLLIESFAAMVTASNRSNKTRSLTISCPKFSKAWILSTIKIVMRVLKSQLKPVELLRDLKENLISQIVLSVLLARKEPLTSPIYRIQEGLMIESGTSTRIHGSISSRKIYLSRRMNLKSIAHLVMNVPNVNLTNLKSLIAVLTLRKSNMRTTILIVLCSI